MAVLENRITLTIEDLESYLGASKLPRLILAEEDKFLANTARIAGSICAQTSVRAIFISGPTSSGKTTFTDRLGQSLTALGRKYLRISLDDYYEVDHFQFDADGRPDYESLRTIDTVMAASNIKALLAGEKTLLPEFDFQKRERVFGAANRAVKLPEDALLLVEGLHGLSPTISGSLNRDLWQGIFIMPWGEILADRRLLDGKTIRLLRRISRDYRNRGAHAIATIDYWPMVLASEQNYFPEYLAEADYYVNSFLHYESLITAPMALRDIQIALRDHEQGQLIPSVFLAHHKPNKAYADLPTALVMARQLAHDLARIPKADATLVPDNSILQEFI